MACRLTLAALATLLIAVLVASLLSPTCAFVVDGAGVQEPHHLHLYMHDGYTGPNPSAVVVVNGTGPTIKGSGGARFGTTVVMDDPLTEGPGSASRVLGRAQGFYVTATSAAGDPAMLVSMNVLLTDGPYNGSTLAVTGRNAVMAPERELSVVGGTGRFRMARGYVLIKTASWSGNDAVLELNIFVHA